MKLLVVGWNLILLNFIALSLQNSKECSWSPCFDPNTTNQTEIVCPQGNVEVDSKPCSADNTDKDGGITLYCCSNQGSSFRQEPNVLFWPNDDGKMIRTILNCPYPDDFPALRNIRFFLFTKNNTNGTDYKEIFTDDIKSLEDSEYIRGAPLRMITHGFMSNAQQGPAQALRAYYIQLSEPVNIIGVDWRKLANYATYFNPCYNIAAQSVQLVGEKSARMLQFLVAQNYTKLSDIHVLGHSLGAHCAGFTGKNYSPGKLIRITGFDPARPRFTHADATKRIDYSDANFVDIIHTATKDLAFLGGITMGNLPLGLEEQVGHADFFPNKGTNQPGCSPVFPIHTNPSCSHGRSYQYYAESVKPPTSMVFKAILCRNMEEVEKNECAGPHINMGEYTILNNRSRYIYYVKTNDQSPFAMDEE